MAPRNKNDQSTITSAPTPPKSPLSGEQAVNKPGSRTKSQADKPETIAKQTAPRAASKAGKPAKKEKLSAPPVLQANTVPFPVVGIGASAGGLAALTAFLKNLPAKTGIAFILAQHRSPIAKDDLLIALLKNHASVDVVEINDGMTLAPDRLHVPPPGYLMGVFNGRIQLFKEELGQRERLPIDFFMRSLAEDMKERAGAVVLSGADTDGTLGVKAVKGNGGLVIVQDPVTAEFNVMPGSAAQTGVADFILPPEKMPAQIIAYMSRAAALERKHVHTAEEIPHTDLEKVLLILRSTTGNDFSPYKHKTVIRRIKRRMDLQQIDRLADYAKYLKENPKEIQELFRDLLIGVTTFFRDPDAFQALKLELAAYLKDQPKMKRLLRVWVPACSSGEEAYSVAIIAKEALLEAGQDLTVQIYATDLDAKTIESARQGSYPLNIAPDVPEDRLLRYFSKTDAGYKIRAEIREMIVFSVQNILQDPPFSRLDLVCCRNLLIYLNSTAQKRVLSLFNYSLLDNGLLFLGTSESVGSLTDLFLEKDKKWRIYARKPAPLPQALYSQAGQFTFSRTGDSEGVRPEAGISPTPQDPRSIAERFLLEKCVPVSVLVTQAGEILHIQGKTGKYLELPPGKPATNIFAMAKEGLKPDLTSSIGLAASTKKDVAARHVTVKVNGGVQHVDLSVRFVLTAPTGQNLLLVSFSDVDRPKRRKKGIDASGEGAQHSPYDVELEQELQAMRENLQAVSEEYATTTEELKSMNEELQSSNEELQSTNEEMETAKEELQSINEEQVTLNSELQSKIEELSHVNNDMANLLAGSDIATLFLDTDLNIMRFTPATQKILNLIHSDIGRPVSHLASNLNYTSMVEDAQQVLSTLHSKEIEVRAKDGSWFQTRILPYRTTSNVIEGLVLTFNDITKIKQSEQKAQMASNLAEGVVNAVQTPFLVLDKNLAVTMANKAYYRTFQAAPETTLGHNVFEMSNKQWNIPKLREMLKKIGKDKGVYENVEVEHVFPKLGKRKMLLNVRLVSAEGEEIKIVLAFSNPISD